MRDATAALLKKELTTSDEQMETYLKDLSALEEEKREMEDQLQKAQTQQREMLTRMNDMKRMMSMFDSLLKEVEGRNLFSWSWVRWWETCNCISSVL